MSFCVIASLRVTVIVPVIVRETRRQSSQSSPPPVASSAASFVSLPHEKVNSEQQTVSSNA
jgi:hypothetical protein